MPEPSIGTTGSDRARPCSTRPLEIPILNGETVRVGTLVPFSDTTAADPAFLQMLTEWRNKHRHFFLTQFDATVPRTRQWLEHVILPDQSRLMFFIHEQNDEPIGHIGVRGLDQPNMELDNMLRGRSGRNGRLMYFAEVALLRWLFEVRHATDVYLHVLTNNWMTINLHSSIGFRMVETFPLVRKEMSGEVHLHVGTTGGTPLEAMLGRMVLSPDAFDRFLKEQKMGCLGGHR